MRINGVEIEDTYAEGFFMSGTRFLITADTPEWALEAGRKATGFATSIIACGCGFFSAAVVTAARSLPLCVED